MKTAVKILIGFAISCLVIIGLSGLNWLVLADLRAMQDKGAARAKDTVHTMLFNIGWADAPHRVLRNKAVEEWEAAGRPESGRRPGEGEIVGSMTRLGATFDVPRYSAVTPMTDFEGDMEYVALYAGESCELVNDVKPAAAIVSDVVREAEEILKTLGG